MRNRLLSCLVLFLMVCVCSLFAQESSAPMTSDTLQLLQLQVDKSQLAVSQFPEQPKTAAQRAERFKALAQLARAKQQLCVYEATLDTSTVSVSKVAAWSYKRHAERFEALALTTIPAEPMEIQHLGRLKLEQ